MILSIITNAKDALRDNETLDKVIVLSVKSNGNMAIINIKDSAGGIENEILNKIFEPYYTTKHQSQGKGLGLYMVRNIVRESFGGEISVVNDELEVEDKIYKGTTVEIEIPIKEI